MSQREEGEAHFSPHFHALNAHTHTLMKTAATAEAGRERGREAYLMLQNGLGES